MSEHEFSLQEQLECVKRVIFEDEEVLRNFGVEGEIETKNLRRRIQCLKAVGLTLLVECQLEKMANEEMAKLLEESIC